MTTPGEYEEIARGLYLEGLAVDHQRELVWYSDVIGGGIHGVRFDGTPVTVLNPDRMWTGGIMMNADGSVLSTGQFGIMWNNPDTGKSGWLLQELDGQPINGINEIWPDGTGGIFLGTNDIERIIEGQETRSSELWRLTAEGEAIKLAEDIRFANGLAFDPDRRRLYCNSTFESTWAFDVADDLTLANKRLLLERDDVDGMALDAEGNVWITGFRSSHFTRVAPDGTVLPSIRAARGSITQLRFGGADGRELFFNMVPGDGGDTLKEGGQITERNSVLWRGRSEVPGVKIAPANFRLG